MTRTTFRFFTRVELNLFTSTLAKMLEGLNGVTMEPFSIAVTVPQAASPNAAETLFQKERTGFFLHSFHLGQPVVTVSLLPFSPHQFIPSRTDPNRVSSTVSKQSLSLVNVCTTSFVLLQNIILLHKPSTGAAAMRES